MSLQNVSPDRGKRIGKFEDWQRLFLQVIGPTNLLLSARESDVNGQLLGQNGGLRITPAMEIVELTWLGVLWARADDVPGSGNDVLFNIEIPTL